ncbi:1,4-alpha-glucan branching protein GlgB [Alteromonas sediminis]|uniref:1,4-alpha-glucan branching enzyme GlgB n=1 Tax=Alteromonas sediminis TaxID=2259342 RepID=A0A3N5YFE6_9ALTE|nr:1,4-alpha-glucan branching protein GlgB [Alteromonas sediminis]RPJ68755.1 1,4-alpha-glucan branching protein GlgB [Alteromonas sediminis]
MSYVQQLALAQCSSPFTVLGASFSKQSATITSWQPGAKSVSVVLQDGTTQTLACQASDGLFGGAIKGLSQDSLYKLRVETDEGSFERYDPYQFQSDAYHAVHFIDHSPQNLYSQGGAQQVDIELGSKTLKGTRFCVYAPNASAVSLLGDFNYWDGRCHPMQKTDLGYWVLVIPELELGTRYKYQIKDSHNNTLPHKADPLGFAAEPYPSHASLTFNHHSYQWGDDAWMAAREQQDKYTQPMSIYEVHLGSWKRPGDNANGYLTYKALAAELIAYVKDMNYTHIELLPVSEFPFDGSWGYQPVGMFAPTCRFGSPDDFKYFVDQCHQHGIGVIIDWVPAHFPEDGHGLARFDGSCVYEYEDPKRGWHPDWNSCIYDFGKGTVRQFLVASALFWLDKFHIDGLRVDAVASMLYLDYSRNDGEWIPNVDGGNENYEAISLLRWMNEEVYKHFPGAMTIAEESTSFPKVSRPVFDNGLGFGFKWNMGWMHDSLHYISKDPAYRVYHHNDITFSMVYAFDENFVLPISHDEVVHGKGSLIGKMPGDEWQQAANHRCYAAFMFGHPGKKLNFMGCEFGQSAEWNHDSSLDWHLLAYPKHEGLQHLYRDLNALYKSYPALHEGDNVSSGFEWIDHSNAEQSALSFVRKNRDNTQSVYVTCNFTPVPRHHFRLGVNEPGEYQVILNSDSAKYWGSDFPIQQHVVAEQVGMHDRAYSIELDIPPLATLFLLKV